MRSDFLVWSRCVLTAMVAGVGLYGSSVLAQEPDDTESRAESGQISVPLSGRGMVTRNSNLTVDTATLDVVLVEIGDTVSGTITISHSGSQDAPAVEILDAALFGQNADEFATDFDGFTTLDPGGFIDVTVTLTPMVPGTKSAGLRLSIAGATAPYVLLFEGESRFPLTSDLGTSDENVDLGEILQGATGSGSFTLTNEGEPDAPAINISAISLSGINAASFTTDFQPQVLLTGEALELNVSVNTSVPGFKSATAEIFHDGNNGALQIELAATINEPQAVPVNFTSSTLATSFALATPTTLQFGPDGKLYVGEMQGNIRIFDVTRDGQNNYSATLDQSIELIKDVINHNDDGTRNFQNERLMTGIHVTGTAANPVIYAASSDPRQAAGPSGRDSDLDTNSGILHRLTKNGNTWTKLDLVRGLPRSEENHVPNGLVLVNNHIYINIGGHTNEGVPSNNFAELPEYALSSATLEIDLAMIGETTYDIPTLDGPADQFDPFGGHDGLNQAMLVENGPIEIFASGLRNSYDIVHTEAARFYIWDNGPNTGWGGHPGADCLDDIDNSGTKSPDGLHLISRGYYGGHPNPTRGNKANTFGGQSPIEGPANPIECEYQEPGPASGALTTNTPSTNGLDEYTASNFGGAMKNDLIAIAFNRSLFRVQLNDAGNVVTSKSVLESNLGQSPLDVTSQGDNEVFPGTIWVADLFGDQILVLEPADF